MSSSILLMSTRRATTTTVVAMSTKAKVRSFTSSSRAFSPASVQAVFQQQQLQQSSSSSSSSSSQQQNLFAAASLLAAGGAAAAAAGGTMMTMGPNVSSCDAAAPSPASKTGGTSIMDPRMYPNPNYFDYDSGDDGDSEETTTVTTTATATTKTKTKTVQPAAEAKPTESVNDSSATTSTTATTATTTTTKGGLKDPMTIFAKMALKQELKELQDATSNSNSGGGSGDGDDGSQLSATSPAEERKNASLEAQKEAIQKGELFSPRLTPDELRIEEATRKAKQHSGGLKLFSGNGNLALSLEICRYLGINLGKATVGRFADGEANVVVHENVRGKDCYIIQPTCPPVNDNIMELLLMVSTLRRASARRITVVIPYYGYARQDRKMQARVPISAADVARLMEAMGVDRVIAVDLHCGQIQGFFGPRVPVDNLDGGIVGLDYFGSKDLHNPVVVSPDAGGVYRAKKFKEGLMHKYEMPDIGLAMIVKQRARAGLVDSMDLVGDVKNCDCILVDDMIDTAGTLCKAADVLVEQGARRVFAFASHGLLSGPGNERIANSKMEEVVILNTIPTSPQREANEKLTELSVAPLLAQAIFNIHAKKSISALFK